MKIILAKNGKEIFIDDYDFELVSQYSWYYRKYKHYTPYVITRAIYNGAYKWFFIHQLIMGTIGGNQKIDHKDGNGLNNQRDNLRIATTSDNAKNKKPRGSSKYMGVSKHLYGWLARINIKGKQRHIGVFKCEIDAAKAYNKAAVATGDPFYRLNKV